MSLIERNTPREIKFTPNINPYADGSVLVEFGMTKIHVTAMIDEKVPGWMKGSEKGWVTAEYAMLPGCSSERISRERKGVSGRSQEIQRLIGRSLRAVVDMKKLGERQIIVDCDVLVADGGTRTASISGGFVALKMAINKLISEGKITSDPIKAQLAAISIGITNEGKVIADLNYKEDSTCGTDMNLVMTDKDDFVEIQGTAEGEPFTLTQLEAVLECGKISLQEVFDKQRSVL